MMKKIGVVGAGAMGRGIIQLFAQAGHSVAIFDAADGAAAAAKEFVAGMIGRAVEKGRIEQDVADAALAGIVLCESMGDLADCDVVIEAIIEDMAIKQKVFQQLEAVVAKHCILASNTSSLTVSEIAAGCEHPERLAGLHFFNPVPLMKVAEVIAAVKTSEDTVQILKELVDGAGHRAVVAVDQPGFLVNHAGRGLYTEGLRIIEEQVASVQDVDTVMREALGFRMGPFELLDLTGLDVSSKVMTSIYQQFMQEPRFRPSTLVAPRVAAGLFGRKNGEGWYKYEDSKKIEKTQQPAPALEADISFWIDPSADDAKALQSLVSDRAKVADSPENADVLLIQPWGSDASLYCAKNNLDAQKTVAIDPLPGIDKHRTLMLTAATDARVRDAAHALLVGDEQGVTIINDSAGFICQRVIATIVNIACDIVQRGIATVPDLEDAVRLGLGYPKGPLALGEGVGASRVFEILNTQLEQTGDPRYRPSRWLQRRVALGIELTQAEAARA